MGTSTPSAAPGPPGLVVPSSLGTEHGFDWALLYVLFAALVALLWFLLRGLARRRVGWADTAYQRLDPYAQAMRVWLGASPATAVYCAIWVSTTVMVLGTSDRTVAALTIQNSTNVVEMFSAPIRALVVSSILVADQGLGLFAYLVVFALIVARLEQRLGTPRTLVVWIVAHCVASLITVEIEAILISDKDAATSLAVTQDVGVSYVMVGSLGAYLFLVGRRWRPWYAGALAVGVLGPLILVHGIDDLGHFLATVLGIGTGWAVMKMGGVRPRLVWRELVAHPARTLLPRQAAPDVGS